MNKQRIRSAKFGIFGVFWTRNPKYSLINVTFGTARGHSSHHHANFDDNRC